MWKAFICAVLLSVGSSAAMGQTACPPGKVYLAGHCLSPELAAQVRASPKPGDSSVSQMKSRACCMHCSKGVPCGNSCISATKTCRKPPGCAC